MGRRLAKTALQNGARKRLAKRRTCTPVRGSMREAWRVCRSAPPSARRADNRWGCKLPALGHIAARLRADVRKRLRTDGRSRLRASVCRRSRTSASGQRSGSPTSGDHAGILAPPVGRTRLRTNGLGCWQTAPAAVRTPTTEGVCARTPDARARHMFPTLCARPMGHGRRHRSRALVCCYRPA